MIFAEDTPARERARLVGLGLALVTLLLYLPVAFHDFIFFDDPAYVADNPVVRGGLNWASFKWAFIGWHASNWHPLTWLSHMADCQFLGVNPGPQHFINAILHAANALLVYHLWRRLTDALWPAAVVAALFAWHPLRVESVAWIAERKDVLSTLFGLLSTVAYVRYVEKIKAGKQPWTDYGWALVCFLLALLAKPMLVTLPFVFWLLDFWPLRRLPGATASARLLWEKLPFLVFAAASCVVTFLAQRTEAVMSLHELPLGTRLANAVMAYGAYAVKTIWPVRLAVIYPLPAHYPVPEIVGAAVFLGAVTWFAWRLRGRLQAAWIGWLWFLGTLIPVIGLVQVGNQAYADRYTYWPGIGLAVAIIYPLAGWLASRPALRRPAGILAGAVLAVFALGTVHQLAYWKDTDALFSHTLAVTENNPVAEMIRGVGRERAGAVAEAEQCYRQALKLDPSLMVQMPGGQKRALSIQADLLGAQQVEQSGQPTNAIPLYRAVLARDPSLVEAHNNLANLLDSVGARAEAMEHYREAVRLAPAEALPHENLGTALLNAGQFMEAVEQYKEAARLQPDDARACFLLGKAYFRHGESAPAIGAFRAALERDPGDIQSLTMLARILATDENASLRNGTEAVALAEKANAAAEGGQPYVLDVLAMAYAEAGRFPDAQRAAAKAIELATAAKMLGLADGIRLHAQAYEAGHPFHELITNSLRIFLPPAAR